MCTTLLHIVRLKVPIAFNNLEKTSTIFFEWLNNNCMKVNTGKSYLLLSGNSRVTATIDNSYFESKDELGITIDSNLTICPCKN